MSRLEFFCRSGSKLYVSGFAVLLIGSNNTTELFVKFYILKMEVARLFETFHT